MAEIVTMGELLCEIMRPTENVELYETGYFRGPFPSGAPGIFISTAARLGCSAGIIAGVGRDDFGKNILDRLKKDGVDVSRVLESDKGPQEWHLLPTILTASGNSSSMWTEPRR